MINLSLARTQDLDILREMSIQTQLDTFAQFNTPQNMDSYIKTAFSLEQLGKELNERGSVYQIAWEGDEPLGFCRLRLNDEAEAWLGENTIELQRLYVRTMYHGRGVGATLMEDAIAYARLKKYDWIWLGVWERNFKAQEFYQKWGFERFSEHVF